MSEGLVSLGCYIKVVKTAEGTKVADKELPVAMPWSVAIEELFCRFLFDIEIKVWLETPEMGGPPGEHICCWSRVRRGDKLSASVSATGKVNDWSREMVYAFTGWK